MRILIFNWRDITHPWAGGAELYLHEMAKRWIKKGHTVGWLCGDYPNGKKDEVVDGIHVMRRGGKYTVYISVALYCLLKLGGKYDVVIDGENGIPFFTPLYISIPKILLIHHIHTQVFFKELKFPLSWVAYFLESRLMPLVYRNIKCVTVSESSKAGIKRFKLGKNGVAVIYNGVDLTAYHPGKKSSSPLITYVGRLKLYKSVDVLIRAIKRVVERVSAVKLAIVGTGPVKEKLEKLSRELNLDQCIKFYGYVAEEEKIKILQNAWAFVNPSFVEGWGVTTIEANACGTSAVASDMPGLQDSVLDGKTGFLFKYGDMAELANKLIGILENESLRTKLSKNALEWAKNFSWDKSAEEFLKTIEEVAK